MKTRSFRRRLAWISVISAALGLLAFVVVADQLWQRHRLQEIDSELARIGHALASGGGVKQPWDRIYGVMGQVLGEEKLERRIMTVRQARGRDSDKLLYQSPNWPLALSPNLFQASSDPFEWNGKFDDFYRPGKMRRLRSNNRPENPRDPPEWFLDRSNREPRTANERVMRPGARTSNTPMRPLRKPQRQAVFRNEIEDGNHWRIGVFANNDVHLMIGSSLTELRGEIAALRWTALTAALGALALIGTGAWWLSRKALRPIAALTKATESISASDLNQRIHLPEADQEFVPLIQVYNAMMDRLEASFHQATRFSADASHELKTPLAVMKGTLERALADAPADSQDQQHYSILLEEVDHQQAILQNLLLLSRADAGQLDIAQDIVSFSQLVQDALEDGEMMAEDLALTFETNITPGISVVGDRSLLGQVVHNLLTNAIKYNRPEGRVRVSLTKDENLVILSVANTGDAIPHEAQDQIFKRFYRVEDARSRRTEGSGLGLSLALEIIRAHGGDLTLASSTDEESVLEATLPSHEI